MGSYLDVVENPQMPVIGCFLGHLSKFDAKTALLYQESDFEWIHSKEVKKKEDLMLKIILEYMFDTFINIPQSRNWAKRTGGFHELKIGSSVFETILRVLIFQNIKKGVGSLISLLKIVLVVLCHHLNLALFDFYSR